MNEDDCVSEVIVDEDPALETTHLDQSSEDHTIIAHWYRGRHSNARGHEPKGTDLTLKTLPIGIVHGTDDLAVPLAQGEHIKANYDATEVDYACCPLQGEVHGPWTALVDGKSLTELTFDFIVEQQGLEVH